MWNQGLTNSPTALLPSSFHTLKASQEKRCLIFLLIQQQTSKNAVQWDLQRPLLQGKLSVNTNKGRTVNVYNKATERIAGLRLCSYILHIQGFKSCFFFFLIIIIKVKQAPCLPASYTDLTCLFCSHTYRKLKELKNHHDFFLVTWQKIAVLILLKWVVFFCWLFFSLSQLSLSALSLAKCAFDSEIKPILFCINWNILTKRHCWPSLTIKARITTENHANWFFPDNTGGKTEASRQEFRQAMPVPVTCIHIQHNHKAT